MEKNKYSKLENIEINKLIFKLEFKNILKDKNYAMLTYNWCDDNDDAFDDYDCNSNLCSESVYLLNKNKGIYSKERDYCLNDDQIVFNLLIKNDLSLNIGKDPKNKKYYIVSAIIKGKEIKAESYFENRAILECILLLSAQKEILFM